MRNARCRRCLRNSYAGAGFRFPRQGRLEKHYWVSPSVQVPAAVVGFKHVEKVGTIFSAVAQAMHNFLGFRVDNVDGFQCDILRKRCAKEVTHIRVSFGEAVTDEDKLCRRS